MIHDRLSMKIDVIDGVRTEERDPRRTVTLDRSDLPELPVEMVWRGKHFFPDKVTILYFGNRDDSDDRQELGFYEATISGPIVRKNGTPGVAREASTYFARPAGLSQDRLDRIGEYLVPDYLDPYIDKFDPIDGDITFTAE